MTKFGQEIDPAVLEVFEFLQDQESKRNRRLGSVAVFLMAVVLIQAYVITQLHIGREALIDRVTELYATCVEPNVPEIYEFWQHRKERHDV